MATYCTDDQLQFRTGERAILEWAGDENGDLDSEKLETARLFGYNLINGRLIGRFGDYMPFVGDAIPDALRDIEMDCAIWWLASTTQLGGADYKYNYERALKRLEAIANGDEALISDGVNLSEDFIDLEAGLAESSTLGQTPIFTRSTMYNLMIR